jgi:hypothetical protein
MRPYEEQGDEEPDEQNHGRAPDYPFWPVESVNQ